MSKKMHRCPHCGEEGITYGDRVWSHAPRRRNDNIFGDFDIKCSKCNGVCYTADTNSRLGNLSLWVLLASMPAAIICLYFTKNAFLCFGVVAFGIISRFVYGIFNEISAPILMVDEEGNRLSFVPNTEAKIECNKNLKPYGIYRLQFKSKTENIIFKERFKDGMVPAQIVTRKKKKGVYDLRIIGRKFVPDEILFEGAEFLVEDIDGLFICKGKVTKTELNY